MSIGNDLPAPYEVARRHPLAVLAIVVDRRGAGRLADRLRDEHPGERFIAVVAADEGDDVAGMLAGLAPVLGEMIFTASSSRRAMAGAGLASRALEAFGVGQDFVFTVPVLADAIAYGLGVLAEGGRGGWEGTALLVAGSGPTVEQARQALANMGSRGAEP